VKTDKAQESDAEASFPEVPGVFSLGPAPDRLLIQLKSGTAAISRPPAMGLSWRLGRFWQKSESEPAGGPSDRLPGTLNQNLVFNMRRPLTARLFFNYAPGSGGPAASVSKMSSRLDREV
jgi:hypothetical protein